MSDSDNRNDDPHRDRLDRARERMSADYPDDDVVRPRRRAAAPPRATVATGGASSLLGQDPLTRKLVYGAVGLGGLLVVVVGGWSLVRHHVSGIPVLGPPPGPVREKPKDPGGMQILGAQLSAGDGGDVAHLAPGPEQPRPDALARQYGQPDPQAPQTVAKENAPAGDAGASAPPVTGPVAGTGNTAPPAAAPEPAAPPADLAVLPTTPVGKLPAHAHAAPVAPPTDITPATSPASTDGAAVMSAPVPPVPVASAPASPPAQAEAPPAAPAAGAYGVQLAALNSDAAARGEWDRIVRQSPALFAGHDPVIERVEHAGSVFFRLRTRGFQTIAQATSFCAKVREQGLACTLARF